MDITKIINRVIPLIGLLTAISLGIYSIVLATNSRHLQQTLEDTNASAKQLEAQQAQLKLQIQASEQKLADLQRDQQDLQPRSSEVIASEQSEAYATQLSLARKQVAEEFEKKNVIQPVRFGSPLDDDPVGHEKRTRFSIEITTGAMLKDLGVDEMTRQQIIDALVANSMKQSALFRSRMNGEISSDEYETQSQLLDQYNTLSQYLLPTTVDMLKQQMLEIVVNDARKTVTASINQRASGLPPQVQQTLIERLTEISTYFATKDERGLTQKTVHEKQLADIDQLESELIRNLNESETKQLRSVLEGQRMSIQMNKALNEAL